ncbi:MAG: hypothetical protein ACRD2J_03160 [Thermoanaerobaculia bacterium]
MPKPRPSVLKRQREQLRRDKKAAKAEKRAQRQTEKGGESEFEDQTDMFQYDPNADQKSE